MALTVTTAWTAAMNRADVQPVVSVQLDLGASSFYFCSNPDAAISTTKGGDYVPIVSDITSVARSLDPITRQVGTGDLQLVFSDEKSQSGEPSFIRNIISGNRLRGKRLIVKLGEVSLAIANYASLWRGEISDVIASDGFVTVMAKDAYNILGGRTILDVEYSNDHPLAYIESILAAADVQR